MPGPGGGGHGGGFGGGSHGGGFGGGHGGGFGGGPHGGGFGGGPHGGGFHGGFHPHFFHHRHFFGPWGGGGGCLGFLAFPIILLIIIVVFFGSIASSCFYGGTQQQSITNKEYTYNEETFQDYANDQYFAVFGESQDTEDQILLIFATNDSYDGYYTIAWVGDHINETITDLFGNEETAYGDSMKSRMQNMFKYSFESSMSHVVEDMQEQIASLEVESYIGCASSQHISPSNIIINHSGLSLSGTLEKAVESFTNETGIPLAIVITTENEVFG